MTVHIALKITNGETTDGRMVRFAAEIDEGRDSIDVGIAVGAAVCGIGICRKLQALAYAVRHAGDGNFDACVEFINAAGKYIEFWETHDKQFDEEVTDDNP